jgi:hypothetical protein
MDIGKEEEPFVIEPIVDPVPKEEPVVPEPELEPAEPELVPA